MKRNYWILFTYCFIQYGFIVSMVKAENPSTGQQPDFLAQIRQLQGSQGQGNQSVPENGGQAIATQQREGSTSPQQSSNLKDNTLPSQLTPPPIDVSSFSQNTDPMASMDENAFRDVLQSLMPLTPEQILRLRQKHDILELAKVTPAEAPPKPVMSTQQVELATGATPPVVRLSKGYVSSLLFLDSTGAPWPIQDYTLGDPSSFDIKWDKKSNTITIMPMKLYTYGNLGIRLIGLDTPIMLTLIPGQKVVDYRSDMHVRGLGPNARVLPQGIDLPDKFDDVLLSVLDGVPPKDAIELVAKGGQAQVWLVNEDMYVRTRMKILSPSYISYASSADGMNAYKMRKASSLVVSLPEQGTTTSIHIIGW